MKFALQFCLAAGLLVPVASAAQEATPAATATPAPAAVTEGPMPAAKIGFVDVDLVIDQSRAIRQIVSEIDEDLAKEAKQIDDLERELRRVRLGLEQQGAVLSDAERKLRQDNAVDLLNKIDDLKYSFNRTVRQRQRQTIEPLLESIMRIIGEVGRDEGYDLIVRGELVLYGRQTVDLTPRIIEELDKRVDELRRQVAPLRAKAESEQEKKPEPLPLLP